MLVYGIVKDAGKLLLEERGLSGIIICVIWHVLFVAFFCLGGENRHLFC